MTVDVSASPTPFSSVLGCCNKSCIFFLAVLSLSLLLRSTPVMGQPMRCWHPLWRPVLICAGGIESKRE